MAIVQPHQLSINLNAKQIVVIPSISLDTVTLLGILLLVSFFLFYSNYTGKLHLTIRNFITNPRINVKNLRSVFQINHHERVVAKTLAVSCYLNQEPYHQGHFTYLTLNFRLPIYRDNLF
uniref:ATP synthase protein 8 n=1 Tax=Heterorhabditis bacteriophora TaxID=37862 RepID=A0A1I7XAB1_HETBA